jgi:hypothetical protein
VLSLTRFVQASLNQVFRSVGAVVTVHGIMKAVSA